MSNNKRNRLSLIIILVGVLGFTIGISFYPSLERHIEYFIIDAAPQLFHSWNNTSGWKWQNTTSCYYNIYENGTHDFCNQKILRLNITGSVIKLNDLGDVTITGLIDTQALNFNATSQQWENESMPMEYTYIAASNAQGVWTNQPAGVTELFGLTTYRKNIDLESYSQFRIQVGIQTPGAVGSVLCVQYSSDSGVTWRGIDNNTVNSCSTATVSISSAGAPFVSAYTGINSAARMEVQVRIAGQNGDGVADPGFRTLFVEVK